jgi:hypothetical protein
MMKGRNIMGFYNDWDLQPLAIYNPWVNGFGIV